MTVSGLSCLGCIGDQQLGINYAGSASQGGPATSALNALLPDGLLPSAFQPAGSYATTEVPMLRSHMQMYLPILARLGGLLQAQGKQLPAGYDVNSPLAEINSEVVEISSALIDDSLFQIPADYRATSLPEFLKFLQPAASAPKPPGTNLPGTP